MRRGPLLCAHSPGARSLASGPGHEPRRPQPAPGGRPGPLAGGTARRPPPRWSHERLASPPPFPPPQPVSPPSPRATGGGSDGGGRNGPSRGSPVLARWDVANQKEPKLRAEPKTQLGPGLQPEPKPQPESVASEPGAEEPPHKPRSPVRVRGIGLGALGLRGLGAQGGGGRVARCLLWEEVRSSRWRGTERNVNARRLRGSSGRSFLCPAHDHSCHRRALPHLTRGPTPRFSLGHPKRATVSGRGPQPGEGLPEPLGTSESKGKREGHPPLPDAPRNGGPSTSGSAGPFASLGTSALASRQEGIFPKRNRFIRSFVRVAMPQKSSRRRPMSRLAPRCPAALLGDAPGPRRPALARAGRASPCPERNPKCSSAKSNKDIPDASPGSGC